MERIIRLPHNDWRPRDYQLNLWRYLEGGGKRAIEIAHRRWGKDDVALHWAAVAAHQRVANYWHCLPFYEQARKAIWEAINPHTGKLRIDEAFPKELRKRTDNSSMTIEFKVGSLFRVVGSDDPNSLVGAPPAGITFSEWALSNPSAWAYLAPILEENDGWAVFITTPRGKNHAYSMYQMAKRSSDWFAEIQGIEQTGYSKERVEKARIEYHGIFGPDAGDALIEQEYNCSFEAAVLGSVYGKGMTKALKEGRICAIPFEPNAPVHTAMDLGRTNNTAIWWYQIIANEIRLLEYHQASGLDPINIAELLYGRKIIVDERDLLTGRITKFHFGDVTHQHRVGYKYAGHNIPHDGANKLLAAGGRSIYEQLTREYKLEHVRIVEATSQGNSIAAASATLEHCWFNEDGPGMDKGIECLRQYHYEWDDDKKVFKTKPRHDEFSDGADAFEIIGQVWRNPPAKKEPEPMKGPTQQTIDQMIAAHRRKRLNAD